ncbi:MAG: ABC transporter ATP-binding protein [Armatimonadetes bacterium]|nr:ABC transporter ATP-binding protein [Armatimonadota bacterium]
MSETIVVQGLRKVYHDEGRGLFEAVRGIDFRCVPAEVFGLLGPNGAGKTTTLRMLSTLLRPTDGTARLMGFDVREQPEEVRKNIGFYSASTGLYPRLTARETIEFFARINKYPAQRVPERVQELVTRFGIEEYADARVERLSSGMKQKVSIARTVAHDPPIIILDEPTVGLDILNALEFHELVRELKASGKTIVFSTHIMSEAEKLCDRIAIINRGEILACGTMDELRNRTGEHYLEDIFVHLVRSEP